MQLTATFGLLVCALFFAGTAAAEEKSWNSWFETALKSLKARAVSRFESKTVRVTAVAAVRGAELGGDPMQPYWKGGITEKAAEKLSAEKKEFADAVELVLAGKTEEGKKALLQFEKDHPDSALLADVKEAVSKLPGEETGDSPTEKKPKAAESGKKPRKQQ